MAVYHLSDDKYRIAVDTQGAELKSLRVDGREYIWSGDTVWWGKSSPLLFPIIGRVSHGEYSWRGITHQMTKHGFARDQVFELVETSSTRLRFQLKRENLSADSREWVLKNYPFHFALTVTFQLGRGGLQIAWDVENSGKGDLPFSIGAHPALVFPAESANISVDEMFIDFGRPVTLERLFLNDQGLRNGLTEKLIDGDTQLPLRSALFKDDCIQFRLSALDSSFNSPCNSAFNSLFDSPLNSLTLRNSINNDAITLGFDDFTHFGIWTPYRAGQPSPFLCLEPWYGNDSSTSDDGAFETKEGIITLAPGAVFKASYSLTVEH